ncbi:MAG: peptide chain release factor N(5)-glutamine methyltransferase [Pseudomonadota bacterium]
MTRADAIRLLRDAGVADPARDVRLLEEAGRGEAWFNEALDQRRARRPMAQILGHRDFWRYRFKVTADVLDPRPETETLVEAALKHPFVSVLDLGTGSGAILLSLLGERPEARGVGTDISERAILVAGENAAALGLADRVILPLSDWWEDVGGRYDLIVSNPPYIRSTDISALSPDVREFEPQVALDGGPDGLEAYDRIIEGLSDHLLPGGRVLLEIGPDQAAEVSSRLAAAGLAQIKIHLDLDGRDRVLEAQLVP